MYKVQHITQQRVSFNENFFKYFDILHFLYIKFAMGITNLCLTNSKELIHFTRKSLHSLII